MTLLNYYRYISYNHNSKLGLRRQCIFWEDQTAIIL